MPAFNFKLPSHMPFPLNEIANLIRDIDVLWFRWLSIITSVGGITYKIIYPHETPLRLVVIWNILFIGINLVHIKLLLYERRDVAFNDEEKELYETVFHRFSPVEFMKVLRLSEFLNVDQGVLLTKEGEPMNDLMLIYNGIAQVEIGGHNAALLKDGSFIGEMSMITEGPASATVRTLQPTRYLRWPKAELKKLLDRNPNMSHAMQSIVATDLAKKLMTKDAAS